MAYPTLIQAMQYGQNRSNDLVQVFTDSTRDCTTLSWNEVYNASTGFIPMYVSIGLRPPIAETAQAVYGWSYFGIPDVSSDSRYYSVNIFSPDFKGTFNYDSVNYFKGAVADPHAVGMNSRGLLVESNVAVSSSYYDPPWCDQIRGIDPDYICPDEDFSHGTDTEPRPPVITLTSSNPVAIDSNLEVAVKNTSSTLDPTTFAPGSLANGHLFASVALGNAKDIGHEILSLVPNEALYPKIGGGISSEGFLLLESNGEASVTEWQNALRSVTYQNTSESPTTGIRTFVFNFNDGLHASYDSAQDYIIVRGEGSSDLLRVEAFPNAPLSDLMVAFDTGAGQNAGEAYRLYEVFDREPDFDGLGYWISALDRGVDVKNVAQAFLNSDEFHSQYGANLTDAEFVNVLYNKVLDRTPDQAGRDYWLGALANGATSADILVNFTESNENVANVAPLIANGIQYQEWVG